MIAKKITAEMEQAFIDAAHSPHEQVTESVVAGLAAVMAIVERDHVVVPRSRNVATKSKITNCGCGPEHSRDCPQGLGDY